MNRRGFLLGLSAGIVAPTIVKYSSLMPVKEIAEDWLPCDGRIINPRLYPNLSKVLGHVYGTPCRLPSLGIFNENGWSINTGNSYLTLRNSVYPVPTGSIYWLVQDKGLPTKEHEMCAVLDSNQTAAEALYG